MKTAEEIDQAEINAQKALDSLAQTPDKDRDRYKNLFGKLYVTAEERNKVIRLLKNAICPPRDIPCVGWNNVLLVGLMGTSKTQLINYLFSLIFSEFAEEERNLQYTNSMQYNINHLKDCFYNILATDDAIELQDSYRGMSSESVELSHEYFNIRHEIEDRFERKHGYCLTIWSVQMYKRLQKALRQAPITIFTSIFNDKEENQFLKETLGMPYYKFLKAKSKYVSLLNSYEHNRFCVIKALEDVYYFEFDMPILQLKKKNVNPKTEDSDIKILKDLLPKAKGKLTRATIYEIFSYIYNRTEKEKKQVGETEEEYIKLLYKNEIKSPTLAKLFGHTPQTIFNVLNRKKKRTRDNL